MKKSYLFVHLLSVMALLVLPATLWAPVSVSAPGPSYPMICKGGWPMKLLIDPQKTDIHIPFKKSPNAASQQPPAEGECAWLDRPIRKDEAIGLLLRDAFRISNIKSIECATSCEVKLSGTSREFNYLHNAVKNRTVFYIHCRRTSGMGTFFGQPAYLFEITRIGP
jgi:hypothetical protein